MKYKKYLWDNRTPIIIVFRKGQPIDIYKQYVDGGWKLEELTKWYRDEKSRGIHNLKYYFPHSPSFVFQENLSKEEFIIEIL